MWENNHYRITLKEDSIHDYEKIMLTSGECGFLLPMVFISENGSETAYYKCSGFSAISTYSIERTDDALFILEKVLLILSHVAEYLISPARMTLTNETVFYSAEMSEIKIAYVPLCGDSISLRRNLIRFIAQIKADINDGHGAYLDKIARLIHYENYRIDDIIDRVGLLKRELYSKTSASS
ncbi:MAG: DUF6382 domain-containing protein [Bacillota bacterium]|nr:DUF6382 domain-containing protein [Bacillota bacterium]